MYIQMVFFKLLFQMQNWASLDSPDLDKFGICLAQNGNVLMKDTLEIKKRENISTKFPAVLTNSFTRMIE